MSDLQEMAARMAELDVRRAALKSHIERIEDERGDLEQQLLAAFEAGNTPRIVTGEQVIYGDEMELAEMNDGGIVRGNVGCEHCLDLTVPQTTVHLRRELWISAPEGRPAALAAMRDAGAGDLISETYHAGSASAWMRELERDADDLPIFPPAVAGRLGTSEKYTIRTRRG